jgi:glycosyltransferase involved in cell wall biosynthesis
LPAARNSGLKIARGEYIIHCDSDDWIEKNMYESLYNKAIEEKADIVGSDIFYEFTGNTFYKKQHFGQESEDCFRRMLSVNGIHGSACNRLIKKNIYTDHDIRFPEGISMCEDIVTTLQLHYFAKKISYIPKAFYHYIRYRKDSITQCVNNQQLEDMLKSCQIIKSFLQHHHIYEKYYILFMERVFISKSEMVISESLRDFKRWHSLWPDSNNRIWCYRIVLYDKVLFSFINKKFYFLAIKMLNIRKKLLKLRNKIEGRNT